MSKKISVFIFILLILSGMLTGCYDRREVDEMTYVVAIGFDKGKVEPLKLTFQYAVPKAAGSGGGSSEGGGGSKPIETVTLETPTLLAGLNMANAFIGREVNLSHAVVAVISEELAREDIGPYIYGMARMTQIRPNIHMAVCRDSAEEYLRAIKPIQEVDPSKYYELIFSTYKYTGLIPNSQFYNFYIKAESMSQMPIAVLAGLSKYKTSDEFDPELNTAREKGKSQPFEGDFLAGQIPKVGDQKGELMGLAVFDGTKMVGELDGAETTNFLMVTGEYRNAFITFPDPKIPDKNIVLNVSQSRKPVHKIEFEEGEPKVHVEISLEADFLSIQSGYNYEDTKNTPIVETSVEKLLSKHITTLLDRTAKEFKSDICGFGKQAKKQFLTWKEWEDFKWLDKYKDSAFDVEVNLKIRRPGLLIRSSPFPSTDEKGSSQ